LMTDGKSLEHTGLTPDEMSLPSGADMAAGRDPVLARAAALAGVKLEAEKAGTLFPELWRKWRGPTQTKHFKPEPEQSFLEGRVVVVVGDLTTQEVDAIVNAANSTLLGGGGVDSAIHAAGGPAILEACREIRRTEYPDGLPTGEAVITTAGNLPARHVIHTVGPIYGRHEGREAELLASCYRNSLQLAVSQSLISIAFPAISTGAFGYPPAEAAAVSSAAVREFLDDNEALQEVRLIFFQQRDAKTFLKNQEFR
jgi:O-acetyl-ADP-ribose deacetylase (regulator of RNase III)